MARSVYFLYMYKSRNSVMSNPDSTDLAQDVFEAPFLANNIALLNFLLHGLLMNVLLCKNHFIPKIGVCSHSTQIKEAMQKGKSITKYQNIP